MRWQLAQFNTARLRWPPGDARLADFFAQVPAINALAEASPGFVWRLEGDSGDPNVLANLSVWLSMEALRDFTYRSSHASVFQQRDRWFHKPQEPHQVLWWIRAGHHPDWAEGWARLHLLRQNGPGPTAFTFAVPFEPPSAAAGVKS